jgi:hypothetical protein
LLPASLSGVFTFSRSRNADLNLSIGSVAFSVGVGDFAVGFPAVSLCEVGVDFGDPWLEFTVETTNPPLKIGSSGPRDRIPVPLAIIIRTPIVAAVAGMGIKTDSIDYKNFV